MMKVFIGNDIELVSRFKEIIDKKPQLLLKIFHQSEVDYVISKKNPDQSLAGIWCAKEAVLKAFGEVADLTPRCIEVTRNPNGMPICKLVNEKIQKINFNISVSISHTKEYASASAILIIF